MERGALREDTATGVVFTETFALGIVMLSAADSFRDFTHGLLGNILDITPADLTLISALAPLVLLFLFHKELELTSFDPTHAKAIGLKVDAVRYGLLVPLSLTVVAGVQAVGVVLISALLITPAAAASLVTNSLPRMMLVSAAVAAFSEIVGVYASHPLDVASGAAVVLACTACFVAASLVRGLRSGAPKSGRRDRKAYTLGYLCLGGPV